MAVNIYTYNTHIHSSLRVPLRPIIFNVDLKWTNKYVLISILKTSIVRKLLSYAGNAIKYVCNSFFIQSG